MTDASARTTQARTQSPADVRRLLGHGIESTWLAAVLFVPLIFGPSGWFSFFELPKVIDLTEPDGEGA